MGHFISNEEFKPIARKIIAAHNLHNVNIDDLCFVTNDSGKPKNYACRIRQIRTPYTLFVDYKFYIEMFSQILTNLDSARVAAAIYKCLLHIDSTGETLKQPDVSEFSIILDKLGPNWLYKEGINDVTEPFPSEPTEGVANAQE